MERFRFKSPQELQKQVETTSQTLGTEVARDSDSVEVFKLTLAEIQTKYPQRYKAYLYLLRSQKNNLEINEEELEEMNIWIQALNNLDTYIVKHSSEREQLDPRGKRQLDVFEDIRDSFEDGNKEGYVKLPTGVGKTVLFSRVVESLGLKTLVVVPSKILVKQTGERFEQFSEVEFGSFFQGAKDLSKNVTITTYSSLIRGVTNGTIQPGEYKALILDEAHKALGEKTQYVVEKFNGIKLGFTATPEYSKRKHVSDLLEHEIHSMSVVEAVQEGLISRFRSYLAYTDTDLSAVEVDREGYDPEQLEQAVNKQARNQSAVELYKAQFEGQSAVAYCSGVVHAESMCVLFNESGVKAEVISGNTGAEEQMAILQRFQSGETLVLCNARILIEGFDEPRASVCLNIHPTLSRVDAEQRAGRVLRLDPNNQEKWAHVVDFIDRNPRVPPHTFVSIAEASRADQKHAVTIDEDEPKPRDGEYERDTKYLPDLNLGSLKFVVDAQKVLEMSYALENERDSNSFRFEDLKTLKEKIRALGIKSVREYSVEQKLRDDLPSNPQIYYRDSGWVSWLDLFGKEEKSFLTLNDLKLELKKLNINSANDYFIEAQKHISWPAHPQEVYKSEWISWLDLFGKEELRLTLDELKTEMQQLKIDSVKKFNSERKNHPKWPSAPDKYYKDWVSWFDLFGKQESKFLTIEELKAELHRDGIRTFKEYSEKRNEHPSWPSTPSSFYKDSGWVSFNDLFGKNKS